jgi:hypothetical protein
MGQMRDELSRDAIPVRVIDDSLLSLVLISILPL